MHDIMQIIKDSNHTMYRVGLTYAALRLRNLHKY